MYSNKISQNTLNLFKWFILKLFQKKIVFIQQFLANRQQKKNRRFYFWKKKIVLIKLKINRIYNKNNQLNFTHELNGF